MTRGAEKHLLKQFAAGNGEAFSTLVGRKRAIVRDFLAAGVDPGADALAWEVEAFSRAYLEIGKLDPEEEDLTVHILDILRDLSFQKLPEAQYRKTLFATGRETFASPPHLPALGTAALKGEEPIDLTPWRTALGPRQLLLPELVFLEAAPIEGVAELINCSENILQAFLYHVLDSMAELSALAHQEGCPPDLVLGIQVVRVRGNKQRVARLREENARCTGCKELIERAAAVVALWSRDWRSEPEGTAALLSRIGSGAERHAPGSSSPEMRPQPIVTTVPFEPAEPERRSLGPLVGLGLLLTAFVGASVHFLGKPETGRPPATAGTPVAATRPPSERKLPEKIGTLSSASAASDSLFDGSEVATDLRNPASLAYDAGTRVELAPGGSGRAGRSGFTIVNGTARVEVPAGTKSPFSIATGDVTAVTQGGVVTVLRTPGRRTLVAVERGGATLTMGDGRTVQLEPGRQAAIDLATGRSTISDHSPADFSSLAGTDIGAPPLPPAPGPPPPDDSGTAAPSPRGPSLGSGGVRPADVRGFRDSF
ncbi:MAG: FecR domain-containing protein [Candidatus Wallbacteria bacterium]|nr:FecR domain-containing protein [Candidatus Wallbacteria bacterium]